MLKMPNSVHINRAYANLGGFGQINVFKTLLEVSNKNSSLV